MRKIVSAMLIFGGINMLYSEHLILQYSGGVIVETNQITDLLSIFLILFGAYMFYYEIKKSK